MIPADRQCWCRGKFWDLFFPNWVIGETKVSILYTKYYPKSCNGGLDVDFSAL